MRSLSNRPPSRTANHNGRSRAVAEHGRLGRSPPSGCRSTRIGPCPPGPTPARAQSGDWEPVGPSPSNAQLFKLDVPGAGPPQKPYRPPAGRGSASRPLGGCPTQLPGRTGAGGSTCPPGDTGFCRATHAPERCRRILKNSDLMGNCKRNRVPMEPKENPPPRICCPIRG